MSSTVALPAIQQAHAHHGTIAKPKLEPRVQRAEAEEAAMGLESIFLQMLIKDMRKNASAMGGDGFFGKGVGSGIKEDLFDNMLATRISKTGQVGLADSVLRDWEEAGKIPPIGEKKQVETGASQ